jgi:hypothetical protein
MCLGAIMGDIAKAARLKNLLKTALFVVLWIVENDFM